MHFKNNTLCRQTWLDKRASGQSKIGHITANILLE